VLTPLTPETHSRFTALVIGPAGIGKTSLLHTISPGQKVCVLSGEGGLLSVRSLLQAGTIEGWEIHSLADFKQAYEMLATDVEMKTRYEWVFIDSLTEISDRCVETMKSRYPSKSDSYSLWGDYADSMTALIKGFRDLSPYSVIFTCLDQVEKDELNRRYYGPAIPGRKLKDRLTSYLDEVLYMTSTKNAEGKEERVFICHPWERYPGKDRSGKLDVFEQPDLGHIANKILGEREEVDHE